MSGRGAFIVWVMLAVLGCPLARGDEPLPKSPLQPTLRDCQRLLGTFKRLEQDAYSRLQHCLLGPARIGLGDQVSWLTCRVSRSIRAWPQCFPVERESCDLGLKREAEYGLCLKRAHQTDAPDVDAKLLNDAYSTYRKSAQVFGVATGLMSDPKKAIFDVLMKNSTAASALSVFSADGTVKNEHVEDVNELYRLAFSTVNELSARSSTGVVAQIQKLALVAIRQNFDFVEGQMNEALRQMDSLHAEDIPTSSPRPSVPYTPLQSTPLAVDCSVLQRPDDSRSLQERDEDAWLALVGRCSR